MAAGIERQQAADLSSLMRGNRRTGFHLDCADAIVRRTRRRRNRVAFDTIFAACITSLLFLQQYRFLALSPASVLMKSSFQIAARKDVGCEKWDALADASDEAWLWHRYDLQDALATWKGATDESFALIEANEKRALALIPLRRVTRRAAGIIPAYILECFG